MYKIFIFDGKSDRRAERFAMPDAGEDFNRIALDFLPRTAPVALLPPPKLEIYPLDVDFQSGGQAFDDGDERAPVRFSGGRKFKKHKPFIMENGKWKVEN
jgi:hypothetical protein